MNNIRSQFCTPTIEERSPHSLIGSIWKHNDELCIFAQVSSGRFCLVLLNEGNRLNDPSETLLEIVDGANLVAEQVNIYINDYEDEDE